LPVSVTAANTPTPVRIRASKLMHPPMMTEHHLSIDLYALKSSPRLL